MSLLSENVIPGNHGKIFETNAIQHTDLIKIKDAITNIDGIKDVVIEEDVFPKQLTIHTTFLVSVKDIEDAVIDTGFHAIPKSLLDF
jgi:copper chaperone CopZ